MQAVPTPVKEWETFNLPKIMEKEFINKTEIADVLIERPIGFSIGRKHFSVYPATLGKIQLYSRLIEVIGITLDNASVEQLLEKAESHRSDMLRLVAYSTLPGADCLEETKVKHRIGELKDIEDTGLATMVLVAISGDKSQSIIKQYGIDVELNRLKKVMKVKEKDKSTFSFAGKSVWGTIIDSACERYGWSYQYVLWGISYTNLQLLLADQVKTVYLSEEERKRANISNDSTVIRIEDKDTLEAFIKSQSWK